MIIKNNEINTPLTTIFYDIETDKSDGFISNDGELTLTAEHELAKYVTTGTICFYKNTNDNKNRAVSISDIRNRSFNMKPHLFVTATPPHTGYNIGNHQNEVYEYTRQKDFLLRMNFLPADRPCFYIMNTSLHKPFETITDSTDIHAYIK